MREEMESSPTDDMDQAVAARRRDHVWLDDTLVCIGLLNERELTRIQAAQSHCDNGVDPPLSATAVRIRLGDILLRRVPVALSGCWSPQCTRAAAQRIGWALGWNQLRIGREAENFEAERAAFLVKPSGLARPQRAA